MSQKALDVLFRHKVLIALPLVVLVAAGLLASVLSATPTYRSEARAWSQDTPFFANSLNPDNPFLSPAQNQAQVFNDLMKFDSFVLSVAADVPELAGYSPTQQAAIIRSGTTVTPIGPNVLAITHQNENKHLPKPIVTATINAYQTNYSSDVIAQGDAAIDFYETRLEDASVTLTEKEQALADYRAAAGPDFTGTDSELTRLESAVQTARDNYDGLLDRLQEINLQKEAALTGNDVGFQIIDQPQDPLNAEPLGATDVLALPMIGLMLGISAAGALLFALIRLDDRVRLPNEIKDMNLPVVASLPHMGLKRERSWPQHFVRLTVMASRGLIGGGQ